MYKTVSLAVLAALCLAADGCEDYEIPTVTFTDVDLVHVDAAGMTLDFEMEVYNPNPRAIPLERVTYTLRIGRESILDGGSQLPATLPAEGTLPVTVPVSLTWPSILSAEETIRRLGGDIPYTFEGELYFDVRQLRLGKPARIDLYYEGMLPVREVLRDPSLLLRSEAVRELAGIVLGQVFDRPQEERGPVRE
jgi:LEA14-like dessication related protein